MEKIVQCHCGCGITVYNNGESSWCMTSNVIEGPFPEAITHIDSMGFINGKYSLPPHLLEVLRQEMEFCR